MLALGLVGCGGGETTTTKTPPSTQKTVKGGSVTAQPLHVETRGDQVKGGFGEFTVTVAPNPAKKVSLGVQEQEVFATGPQWRSTAWSAALAATNLLNLNMADYKVTYEVSGRAEGPSAGALMTSATLAAMLGDKLDPSVTMTGCINPDFTVGPVGGIPQKLEGAVKAKKKKVLIPVGQVYDTDEVTGKAVDVIARGKELGLTVKEVSDIYEAYQELTGKTLPKVPVLAGVEPALSTQARDTTKQLVGSWAADCQQNIDNYKKMPASAKSDYEEERIKEAQGFLSDAADQLSQGQLGAALSTAEVADRKARIAATYTAVEQHKDQSGNFAAASFLRNAGVEKGLAGTKETLLATTPGGVNEAASLLSAWSSWAIGNSYLADGEASLATTTTDSSGKESIPTQQLYDAVLDYVLATVMIDKANDALALGKAIPGAPLPAKVQAAQPAEAYRRAAEANMETFDVLVVPALADAWQQTADEVHQTLYSDNVRYSNAIAALNAMQGLTDKLPAGPARDYAVLGTALSAYVSSSLVLAEYNAYGAQFDKEGTLTGFAYDKAFSHSLDFGREQARSMISLASTGGADAALPTIQYDAAQVWREGSPSEKLDALKDFWTASVVARSMAALRGQLKPLAPR
jgi:uncharacterized protein